MRQDCWCENKIKREWFDDPFDENINEVWWHKKIFKCESIYPWASIR